MLYTMQWIILLIWGMDIEFIDMSRWTNFQIQENGGGGQRNKISPFCYLAIIPEFHSKL